MSQPLFLDIKPTFQKVAMPVRLSESPEAWQRDIAGEIYKQLPYIGEYAVNVILDRVDAQRGYGFGSAHISNRTEAPMQQQEEMPSVRIPIVIRDYLMSPLDLFMDNSGVYPLTESRLREKLFRPETMEMSTRKPSDRNLSDQLYPPMRSNYGMNSMSGEMGGIGKMANAAEMARRSAVARMKAEAAANPDHIGTEKCSSLIEAIAPTLSEKVVTEFVEKIASDRELAQLAVRSETFQKLAMIVASAPTVSVEKTASALVDSIKPTVVQFEKLSSGDIKVKWANAQAFAPQEDVVTPQAAQGMGADTSGMKPGDTMTVSSEKAQKQSLHEEVYVKVEQFGKYCVQSVDTNSEHCGFVVPVVDFEMHPLELFVFIEPGHGPLASGGSNEPTVQTAPAQQGVWGCQDEIAGKVSELSLEEWTMLGDGQQPQGSGMFISVTGQCCLLPMTIQNGAQGGLMGETMFGEPVTLQMVPGLQTVEMMGEGVYGIPQDLKWVSLPGEPVFLAKSPLDIQNTQQAQQMPQQIEVGSTSQGEFSMRGQPLAKVAADQRIFIKRAQAEFLLVAAGLSPADAKSTLDRAETSTGWVKCAGHAITPLASLHKQATKQASSYLASLPNLRMDLVKEATIIEDADTADKVLSMNFINPENVGTFAKFLPELDEAAKKLAELLLGVRLGIGSVDEGAVERAMKGLEAVIDGLKMLQQKVTA